MKRVSGHMLAGLALGCAAASVCAACVHDDSSLFIRNVLASQFQMGSGSSTQCTYLPDPTQAYIPSGVLDVALRTQYDATFMVGNQLVPQANTDQLRTETSEITIRGAIVRITDSMGNQLRTFTRDTSATLNPSTGMQPGWEPVSVTIIDTQTVQQDPDIVQLASVQPGTSGGYVRLVTFTRFFGYTLGGQYTESDEFQFPVDVCNGCLIGFSNAPDYFGTPLLTPNCAPNNASGASSTTPAIPCWPGQDLAIDCSSCQGDPVCRGVYPAGLPVPDAGAG